MSHIVWTPDELAMLNEHARKSSLTGTRQPVRHMKTTSRISREIAARRADWRQDVRRNKRFFKSLMQEVG